MKEFPLGQHGFSFLILFGFLASSCSLMSTSTLEQAVDYKNIKEVRRHLNEGANVNLKDKKGQTPLHHAAESGYTEGAQTLIERGARVNARDKAGRTPLHLAAEIGYTPTVDLLITKGARVNSKDINGRIPLHYAVIESRKEASRLLI